MADCMLRMYMDIYENNMYIDMFVAEQIERVKLINGEAMFVLKHFEVDLSCL